MKCFNQAAICAGLLLSCAVTAAPQDSASDFWQTPTIAGYGKMHPLPKAAYQPKASEIYKIVFAVSKGGDKPGDISPALDRVARTVNLYVSAGVPLDHLKFVAVVSGAATDAMLDDVHYTQKLGVGNPNLDLIRALRRAGVDVTVCGQAMADHEDQYDWLAPEITLALSAVTTITTLEHEGYVLMPL